MQEHKFPRVGEHVVANTNNAALSAIGVGPYGKYFRDVSRLDKIDVYRVLQLFNVTDQAIGHAIKKLLLPGVRTGGKTIDEDVKEAVVTLTRWQAMRQEDKSGNGRVTITPRDTDLNHHVTTARRAVLAELKGQLNSNVGQRLLRAFTTSDKNEDMDITNLDHLSFVVNLVRELNKAHADEKHRHAATLRQITEGIEQGLVHLRREELLKQLHEMTTELEFPMEYL